MFHFFYNLLYILSFQESGGPGVVRFSASEMGEQELGRIVEDCTVQVRVVHAKDARMIVTTVNDIDIVTIVDIVTITTVAIARGTITGSYYYHRYYAAVTVVNAITAVADMQSL